MFGYDTGIIDGALPFIRQSFDLPALDFELVVSALLAGAFVGAAAAGGFAQRWGRRTSIMLAGVIEIVGADVSAVAPGIGVLIAGRVLVGVAIGATSVVCPLYIAELAPAGRRGGLVAVYQLALTIGIFLSVLIAELFEPFDAVAGVERTTGRGGGGASCRNARDGRA
jgi:SP family galactose:H+ symporter-like MFS transporter